MRAEPAVTSRTHVPSPVSTDEQVAQPDSATTVVPGTSASLRGPAAGAAAPQTQADLKLLQKALKRLCEHDDGIAKVIVGEEHQSRGNIDLLCRAIEGGLYAKRGKVSVYREMGFRKEDAQVAALAESVLASHASRPIALDRIQEGLRHSGDSAAETAQFRKIAGRQDVAFKLMNWFDPERRDMTRFIQDRTFAIASVGAAHALHNIVDGAGSLDTVTWLGGYSFDRRTGANARNVANLPELLRVPAIPRAAQVDAFNGLERSRAAAPTLFLATSAMWAHEDLRRYSVEPGGPPLSPLQLRKRFIEHYTANNCVVLEMPLAHGLGTVMVIPSDYSARLDDLLAAHPDSIRIHRQGLEDGKS